MLQAARRILAPRAPSASAVLAVGATLRALAEAARARQNVFVSSRPRGTASPFPIPLDLWPAIARPKSAE